MPGFVSSKARISALGLVALILPNLNPSASFGLDLNIHNINVLSSENITTDDSSNILKVYLNTFKPNDSINFRIDLNNSDTATIYSGTDKIVLPPQSGFQFAVKAGKTLAKSAIGQPLKVIKDASGSNLIEVFPAPPDIPLISLTGNTSLIANKEILSTPVVSNGTYVIDSIGTNIRYFYKSPNNIIGFRRLSDAPAQQGFGGVATYAFLEQTQFGVSATSPGIWRLLDSNFQTVQRINNVSTKFGTLLPEGHGITIGPSGNPIVITTVTRAVDSSWLKRQYNLPILDCDIAEIKGGKAINEFSFWDWAVANKSVSEPLLDSMQLFNDPQNPTSSPIDICHANSLQFYKGTNKILLSLRSPSILMTLTPNLQKVVDVIPTADSLQHFARFVSPTEITALGNFTFANNSQFLDFKLVAGKWNLTQTPFPVHVTYCGNTQYLDKTHIWLAGGCGPFTPGTLGAVYSITAGKMTLIGEVKMDKFTYSYRADLA